MNGLKLGFVQTNPVFGEKEKNTEEAINLSKEAGGDLIVFPELFNTGYAFASKKEAFDLAEKIPNGYTTMRLMEHSREDNKTIVAGLAERLDDKIFNSAVVVSNGRLIGVYRKVHLFYKEKLWFSIGNTGFKVFDLESFKLGVMICFDWFFPESARILALEGADVIAHPSNLVLPGLCQKATLIRSLENKLFIITANRIGTEIRGNERFNYTGRSQITSPSMRILASAEEDEVIAKVVGVDVFVARNKNITKLNHAIQDRRVEFYQRLAML